MMEIRSNWRHYAKECDVFKLHVQDIEDNILKETIMLT